MIEPIPWDDVRKQRRPSFVRIMSAIGGLTMGAGTAMESDGKTVGLGDGG
jgi:hypothetical protein